MNFKTIIVLKVDVLAEDLTVFLDITANLVCKNIAFLVNLHFKISYSISRFLCPPKSTHILYLGLCHPIRSIFHALYVCVNSITFFLVSCKTYLLNSLTLFAFTEFSFERDCKRNFLNFFIQIWKKILSKYLNCIMPFEKHNFFIKVQ